MKSNFFNFNRFVLQLKRDVAIYYKIALILYSIIVLPFLIKLFLGMFSFKVLPMDMEFQKSIFFKVLPLVVFIFSAFSFRDFRSDLSAQFYLMLPVSHFEKFLSMWVIVFVLNPIATVIAFYVIDVVFVVFTWIFTKYFAIFNIFHIFQAGSIEFTLLKATFIKYLAFMTIFFAGAASFKKDAWLKTLLVSFVISFALVIVLSLTVFAYISLLKHIWNIDTYQISLAYNVNPFDDTSWYSQLVYAVGIVVFTALAYFKIIEKEV